MCENKSYSMTRIYCLKFVFGYGDQDEEIIGCYENYEEAVVKAEEVNLKTRTGGRQPLGAHPVMVVPMPMNENDVYHLNYGLSSWYIH